MQELEDGQEISTLQEHDELWFFNASKTLPREADMFRANTLLVRSQIASLYSGGKFNDALVKCREFHHLLQERTLPSRWCETRFEVIDMTARCLIQLAKNGEMEYLKEAIELLSKGKKNFPAYMLLGEAYELDNKYELAINVYTMAIRESYKYKCVKALLHICKSCMILYESTEEKEKKEAYGVIGWICTFRTRYVIDEVMVHEPRFTGDIHRAYLSTADEIMSSLSVYKHSLILDTIEKWRINGVEERKEVEIDFSEGLIKSFIFVGQKKLLDLLCINKMLDQYAWIYKYRPEERKTSIDTNHNYTVY